MGPFLKSENKTNKMMFHLLISILPIVLFAIYKNGYIPYINNKTNIVGLFMPLLFILVGSLTSFLCELIVTIIKKDDILNNIKNSYSFFPGLFLALILPLNTPIYVLILGSLFATIFGKLIFGGFGKNIFNPALVGYVFIFACFGSMISSNTYFNAYEVDTITSPTPLTNASMQDGIGNYNSLINPYGNLLNFFIGTVPGSIGEVSSFLCLLAFAYLTYMKVIKWKISVSYISTAFVITFIIARILGVGIYYPVFQILSGGLLFGAIFMATDPVTSPVTSVGQILHGMFLGIFTILFRFLGVEGVATSIILMNLFVPLFDKIGSTSRFELSKSLIWFTIVWILIIFTGVYISRINKNTNFNLISKEVINNQIIFVATQKGYGGEIKAKVVFENDKLVDYEIISHSETKERYSLIEKNNYINKIKDNYNNLDDVDTVSSATITSKALKDLIKNVMEVKE